ncbi:LOW QUALITY PROTEIN: CASP8 and FADD-like apoptosis regulator [Pelodytes ibericus]
MPPEELLCAPQPYQECTRFRKDWETCGNAGMSSPQFSNRLLLHIEEDLDDSDVEVMLFVCIDFACHSSIRALLSDLNERSMLRPTGLVELFAVVKRFDLLKKNLSMTKAEAETLLATHTRLLPCYRVLMAEINDELEESDLDSLLFLLKNQMRNGGKLPPTFLSLVVELEKKDLIGPENLEMLEQSFKTIRRIDLLNKICKKMQEGHAEPRGPYIHAFGATPTHNKLSHSTLNSYKSSSYKVKGKTQIQESRKIIPAIENDERYMMRLENVGFCLIIDCVGNDADMLEDTFKNLHFAVTKYKHSTTRDLTNILQDVSRTEQLRNHDIFLCIIISRGYSDGIFGIDDETSSGIPLDEIKNYFTGQSCPYLIGKPKLFFIQNYVVREIEQASTSSMVEVDGPVEENVDYDGRLPRRHKIPNEADIFWSHCKVDEMELQHSPGTGSLYLWNLCSLLSDRTKKRHLLDIHTQLNFIICQERQECPLQLKHTLTKKLFLPSS